MEHQEWVEVLKPEIDKQVAGYEQCETAWAHLLGCPRCREALYNVFLAPGMGLKMFLGSMGFGIGMALMERLVPKVSLCIESAEKERRDLEEWEKMRPQVMAEIERAREGGLKRWGHALVNACFQWRKLPSELSDEELLLSRGVGKKILHEVRKCFPGRGGG